MNPLLEALLMAGGIFAAMMLTQYGRRKFGPTSLARPLLITAALGGTYLTTMPFSGVGNLLTYLAGLAVGVGFGIAAAASTKVDRDPATGAIYTVCGRGFLMVWLVAMCLRLAFVWAVTDLPAVREHFGMFLVNAGISVDAIAPFFIIWAIAMVLTRVSSVVLRSRALQNQQPTGTRELTVV